MGLFKKALGFALISQGLFGAAVFTLMSAAVPGFVWLIALEVLLLIWGIVLLTGE
jgi:hypothetical protein